jgi:hypothetical protein
MNIEDMPGYDTSDVFVRHPTDPGLFKMYSQLLPSNHTYFNTARLSLESEGQMM